MVKKLLSFSFLMVAICLQIKATTHIVQVSSNQFTPATGLNVNVGDTVQFNWISGNHTTTSVSIPNGAAPWDSPMTSSVPVFKYKVTVAGTYGYKCTPHAGGGMVGTFTASTVTGVPDFYEASISTSVYPNPFTNELFIEQGNEQPEYSQISISDILGKQIKAVDIEMLASLSGKKRLDVSDLPKGIYFITLKGNGTKARTIRLVKEGA